MSGPRGGSWLTRQAVERPVATMMLTITLVVMGLVAWSRIPVELIPSGFTPPFLYVQVPTLRATPRDIEQRVALPIEGALRQVRGVERVETDIDTNSAGFLVALANGTNMDVAYNEVREQVDRVKGTMGDEVLRYFVWKYNPNDDPVIWMGISTTGDEAQLGGKVRSAIVPAIERVDGVSRVDLLGAPSPAVEVLLDLDLMAARNIPVAEAISKLQRAGFLLAAGTIDAPSGRIQVRVNNELQDLAELRELPITGQWRLRDLAEVRLSDRAERTVHRVNGHEAIFLAIFKESSANAVDVSKRVTGAVEHTLATESALAGLESHVLFNQGRTIEESIRSLYVSAGEGALLAILVIWLFLRRLAITAVIAGAIPASLLMAVTTMHFTGFTLNVLSLTGLILAVGMVVDNAIVVSEQIERRLRSGMERRSAVIEGAGEVWLAILVSTATHVTAFVPLVLMSGSESISFYMGQLGLPVCASIIASLLVSLIWIPWFAAHAPIRLSVAGESGPGRLEAAYGRLLRLGLRRRLDVVLVALALFGSIFVVKRWVPESDRTQANIGDVRFIYSFDDNITTEQREQVLFDAEASLMPHRAELGIQDLVVRMGGWMGRAQVRAFLVSPDERPLSRDEVIARMEKLVPRPPGVRVSMTWDAAALGGGGLDVRLAGRDTERLNQLLPAVIDRLASVPGVTEVARQNDDVASRELRLTLDRERAAPLAVSGLALGAFVDMALRGREVGKLVGGEEPLPIFVQAAMPGDAGPADLAQLRFGALGAPVTVGALAERSVAAGSSGIERVDGRTVVNLVVKTKRQDLDVLGREIDAALAGFPFPDGYGLEKGERLSGFESDSADRTGALILAVTFVFLLMGVLFESFVLPLAILVSIPFAFTGAYWALFITHTPLDVMAGIGFIILVGVVVSNGIVLIDVVEVRRRQGVHRDVALIEAGRERLRPVVMTALTTIVGLIPMAIGTDAIVGIPYSPLGRSLMGGMIFSTLLTLLVVPVVYALLDQLRGWALGVMGIGGAALPGPGDEGASVERESSAPVASPGP